MTLFIYTQLQLLTVGSHEHLPRLKKLPCDVRKGATIYKVRSRKKEMTHSIAQQSLGVVWCHSHPVWLVFEDFIPTCACFHSENFFVTST